MAAAASRFDRDYYDRFYRDKTTRVATPQATQRLARFVCAYLDVMQLPVRRILDIGCGLGWWQPPLLEHFPRARYQGVEVSDYLCDKHGWTKGSVIDFTSDHPCDLVICQGVLQYLRNSQARLALENLGQLADGGVLFLEALTQEDWDENCDQETTDGNVHLRRGSWYRRHLQDAFFNCGGGVFLSRSADAQLFELERLNR